MLKTKAASLGTQFSDVKPFHTALQLGWCALGRAELLKSTPSVPQDEEGLAAQPSRLLWLFCVPCSSAGYQQHGMESLSSQLTAQERRLIGSSPAE